MDKVEILKSDDAGKAVIALVTQPMQPPIVRRFLRGFTECEAYLKRRQEELERLR